MTVAKLTASLGVPFGGLGFLGFLTGVGTSSGGVVLDTIGCCVELWGRSTSFGGVSFNVIGCGVELWGRSASAIYSTQGFVPTTKTAMYLPDWKSTKSPLLLLISRVMRLSDLVPGSM